MRSDEQFITYLERETMKREEFIEKTIPVLGSDIFNSIKQTIVGNYIQVNFIAEDDVNTTILEELLFGYLEKVELQQSVKSFDSIIEKYAADIDSVVEDRIKKSQKDGSGKELNRARKYYEKAHAMRKDDIESFEGLVDYSRIMLCLYMAIIKNKFNPISDFDYSSECLRGREIMDALRQEESTTIIGVKKKRFDTKGIYSFDRCTFVILITMYHFIKNNEMEVEY